MLISIGAFPYIFWQFVNTCCKPGDGFRPGHATGFSADAFVSNDEYNNPGISFTSYEKRLQKSDKGWIVMKYEFFWRKTIVSR